VTYGDDRAPVYAPRVQVLLERLAKKKAEATPADPAPEVQATDVSDQVPPAERIAQVHHADLGHVGHGHDGHDGHGEVAILVDQLGAGIREDGCRAVIDGLVRFSEADWLSSATGLKPGDVSLDHDRIDPASTGLDAVQRLQRACVGGLVAAAGRAAGLRDVTAAAAGRIIVTLGPLPIEELLPAAALTIRTLGSETTRPQADQWLEAEQGQLLQQPSSPRRPDL
jgi:hypothetical protein